MTDSRNRRLRRARPMLALAVVAFAVGALLGARHAAPPSYALADRFVRAWTRGDYVSMFSDIDPGSQRHASVSEFAGVYAQALRTATATGARVAGRARGIAGGRVAVPVRVSTRRFGGLSLSFTFKVREGGEGARIVWSRSLSFPGLKAGETLARNISLPRRATLLARDGSVLAESPAGEAPGPAGEANRSSPLGNLASAVVGSLGAVPASRRQELEAEGVPPTAMVGVSGLEEALDERLRGTPGGALLAVAGAGGPGPRGRERVLAYRAPRPAPAVRTSVSPSLQRAAVTALGGQLGGIVALAPSSGQILAVAGLGLDGLQPPGSTFKMITLTGVLQAHIATPHTSFPYASFATLDGVKLNNANGENCGGTLELAFAVSCNSVFTPLGVKLGSARLVAMAERFGFNHDPGVVGAVQSTLPAPSQIRGELDVGSTAIGQGQVVASPLQMARVAATIADGGRRPTLSFVLDPAPAPGKRVISASVAHTVRHLMIGVVRLGTGSAAAIPGVTVAGKTGTAELKTECSSSGPEAEAPAGESANRERGSGEGCQASEASNTDAWFAAFAPALRPRVVICVLLVKDGAGGDTAAPVAREVIEAALHGY